MRKAVIAAALFFSAAAFAQVGSQSSEQFLFNYMLSALIEDASVTGNVVEQEGCSAIFRFKDGRCSYLAGSINTFTGEHLHTVWIMSDVVDGINLDYVNSVISAEFSDIFNIHLMYTMDIGDNFVLFTRREALNGRR